MSKKFVARSIAAASIALFAGSAYAAPVQVCYKLNPFVDILKLVRSDPGPGGHRSLFGNWIASGLYTIPVSGAFEFEAGSTTIKKIGIVGANSTTSFGDNLICGLTGIGGGGAWELNCSGGSSNVNFQNSGTLNQISCAGLPPSSAVGRAAGSK